MISGIQYTNHATNIAGIIAATTNNGSGIAGIDWNSRLNAIDASDVNEDTPDPEIVYGALISLADNEYKVVNHSYGAADFSLSLLSGFVYSYNHDVVTVAATGNTGGYAIRYPAAYPGVIAVGSILKNGQRSGSSAGWHVDLVAPSANENSSNNDKIYTLNADGGAGYWWGTSMAAPQITGVVSLLRAWKPELSNDDVEWVLKLSARDFGDPGPDSIYGYGLVRADSAFALLSLPYSLILDSVVGPPDVWTSGQRNIGFVRPGGNVTLYAAFIHELRIDVTFPKRYHRLIGAWVRGSKSTGYALSAEGESNDGMYFAEFIPETLTDEGGTLRTYVYDLYALPPLSNHYGFSPAAPSEAVISYSVWGEELLVVPWPIYGADTVQGVNELIWTDTLTNETTWHVDRRVPPADWVNDYALLPAGSTYFPDSNLWGSAQHYYRVRPSNAHQSPTTSGQLQFETSASNAPRNVTASVLMRPIYDSMMTGIGSPNGNRIPPSEREVGDVSAAAAEAVLSQTIRASFSAPANQAVPPSQYVIRAWPEGMYSHLGFCELPPPGAQGGPDPDPNGQRCYEWFVVDDAGSHDVCVDRAKWHYEVAVFAVGFDGQWSVVSDTVWVTTGRGCAPGSAARVYTDGSQGSADVLSLGQNSPNPFNSSTTIAFSLAEPGMTSLAVYNILGQRVRTLFEGELPEGSHEIVWDGRDDRGREIASGLYMYRIATGHDVMTRKMILMK